MKGDKLWLRNSLSEIESIAMNIGKAKYTQKCDQANENENQPYRKNWKTVLPRLS